MLNSAYILTILLSYATLKKYGAEGIEASRNTEWTHLHLFIAFGYVLFILGQNFLLLSDAPLILNVDYVIFFILVSHFMSDIQPIVAKKRPLWLYSFILLEYILWSTIGLIAFLSARNGEGTLFLLACFSRLADLFLVYTVNAKKKE